FQNRVHDHSLLKNRPAFAARTSVTVAVGAKRKMANDRHLPGLHREGFVELSGLFLARGELSVTPLRQPPASCAVRNTAACPTSTNLAIAWTSRSASSCWPYALLRVRCAVNRAMSTANRAN